MAKKTFRIVTQGSDGELRTRDFDSEEQLLKLHVQIGVDDCSTDLSLRGKPVFRGLIGPMHDALAVGHGTDQSAKDRHATQLQVRAAVVDQNEVRSTGGRERVGNTLESVPQVRDCLFFVVARNDDAC